LAGARVRTRPRPRAFRRLGGASAYTRVDEQHARTALKAVRTGVYRFGACDCPDYRVSDCATGCSAIGSALVLGARSCWFEASLPDPQAPKKRSAGSPPGPAL